MLRHIPGLLIAIAIGLGILGSSRLAAADNASNEWRYCWSQGYWWYWMTDGRWVY